MVRLTAVSFERRNLFEGLIRQRDVDAESANHQCEHLTGDDIYKPFSEFPSRLF